MENQEKLTLRENQEKYNHLESKKEWLKSLIDQFKLAHQMIKENCEVEVKIRYKRSLVTPRYNKSEVFLNLPNPMLFKEFVGKSIEEHYDELVRVAEELDQFEREEKGFD